MTDLVMETKGRDVGKLANKSLNAAVKFWFVLTALGQWTFVFYIITNYGALALDGDWATDRNDGYFEGDLLGNVSHILHVALAAAIIGGGVLQLIPQIRSKFPRFHRWNGRFYIPAVIITSIGGLIMVWTRPLPGGLPLLLGISLDAVLIIIFACIAWRLALARRFKAHSRWALRLFMVVSSVWFFRVGLMSWVILAGGPVGFDPDTFMGPFTTIWSFGQYLLPLAILELYFRTVDSGGVKAKFVMASGLTMITLVMGLGIAGAIFGMWFPIQ